MTAGSFADNFGHTVAAWRRDSSCRLRLWTKQSNFVRVEAPLLLDFDVSYALAHQGVSDVGESGKHLFRGECSQVTSYCYCMFFN